MLIGYARTSILEQEAGLEAQARNRKHKSMTFRRQIDCGCLCLSAASSISRQ